MDAPTTTALVVAAREGDRGAWEALVERHVRLVWSVVRGFRLDEATSADVAQTVWLRLVEHLHRIDDPERLPGWLATTARNEALRALRGRRREVPTELVADHPAVGDDEPGAELLAAEERRRLREAFAALPERCRELLRLLTLDPPLDYRSIAEILGRPVGSLGPTRARCLERLRRLLEVRT
ncbi:MAG TPA: sigma-70 family RNA polymerase sigma factor [Actinobacteria bacterium]|nr:sigma-70 family RNA polymerase sigma factor [Actinomycetota bacterium]